MKKIITYLPVLLVVLGFGLYFWLRPHAYYGNLVNPPVSAPNFTLTGADGPVSPGDYRGKLVLLFFGYTFCPDVCPATLANIAEALRILGDRSDAVQVIMVSVDPDRDQPAKLAEFVRRFNPNFVGITGTKAEIDQVTSQYGIYYKMREGTSPDAYFVDHTAAVLVINRENQLVLQIPFGNTPDQIADDLGYLLK